MGPTQYKSQESLVETLALYHHKHVYTDSPFLSNLYISRQQSTELQLHHDEHRTIQD